MSRGSDADELFCETVALLSPITLQIHSVWMGPTLAHLPEPWRQGALDLLITDSLCDPKSVYSEETTWADAIADIVPALPEARVRQLQSRAGKLRSGTARNVLQGAIATRLARLGHLEDALAMIDRISTDHAVGAICEILKFLDPPSIGNVVERSFVRFSSADDRLGISCAPSEYWSDWTVVLALSTLAKALSEVAKQSREDALLDVAGLSGLIYVAGGHRAIERVIETVITQFN
jgi:hypothetical protein